MQHRNCASGLRSAVNSVTREAGASVQSENVVVGERRRSFVWNWCVALAIEQHFFFEQKIYHDLRMVDL